MVEEVKMAQEVYFFFVFFRDGEVRQSMFFDSLEEATGNRRATLTELKVANVSPVMKGYV